MTSDKNEMNNRKKTVSDNNEKNMTKMTNLTLMIQRLKVAAEKTLSYCALSLTKRLPRSSEDMPNIDSAVSWKQLIHWLSVQSAIDMFKIRRQLKVGELLLHFSHL